MGKIFEMEMGGETVRAELLSSDAPETCAAFEKAMPTTTFGVNAKFAGDETIAMLPFYALPGENQVPSVGPGDIGYYPRSQTLCVFYGEIMPFAYINLFAKVVPEDLAKAVTAGKRILEAGSMTAIVRMADGSGGGSSFSATSTGNATADALRSATAAIWENEPDDVAAMRTHKRPPMGNLPCVVYSNFDLFWGTENLHVARQLADELPVAQAGKVAAAYLRRTEDRVGKWGFPAATALITRAADAAESAGSTDELKEILDAANIYLNRLGTWVDSMIPWNDMDSRLTLVSR
jgi:hypothetical protein